MFHLQLFLLFSKQMHLIAFIVYSQSKLNKHSPIRLILTLKNGGCRNLIEGLVSLQCYHIIV